MVSKKLTNVDDGTDPNDAVTKKQLDNVGGSGDITKDIDLKNSYNVIKSKTNTFQELTAAEQTVINFEEERKNFVGINESFRMKTYLDMGDKYIYDVKTPVHGTLWLSGNLQDCHRRG